MENRVQLRWMHDCFTRECSSAEVTIRFVDKASDSTIEVPNVYCSKSGKQLRLVYMDGRQI